jgi:hypothetical protein
VSKGAGTEQHIKREKGAEKDGGGMQELRRVRGRKRVQKGERR